MQHDNASFWADIKSYEERLAQNPESYIFARLSEVYLKVGLVDDALYTARQGVARYPGYIAGQRALALASHARGLLEESCEALEKVTAALPEDVTAQKLLGRLMSMSGDYKAAITAFRTVLEFYPDDVECRLELEVLERTESASLKESSQACESQMGSVESICAQPDDEFGPYEEAIDGSEEIIEDLEILELDEADLLDVAGAEQDVVPPAAPAALHHDPLSTVTLAELYVQQGFIDKALDIYHAILADDPSNSEVQSRIAQLEGRQATGSQMDQDTSFSEYSEAGWEPEENTSAISQLPVQGEADNAVSVLEGWLDNIRRMKACH